MRMTRFGYEGRPVYESPSLEVLYVHSEGVLCSSFDEDNYTENFGREDIEDL